MLAHNVYLRSGAVSACRCERVPKHNTRSSVLLHAATSSPVLRDIDELPSAPHISRLSLSYEIPPWFTIGNERWFSVTEPVQHVQEQQPAAERGLPFIGLAHKMGKELFPPLFEKHGGPFYINMGPLGGWNLAIKEAEDIYDCLSRYDDFEVCVPASTARLAIPQEKNLTNEEARPWRAALFKVMLPEIVLKLQLPLMGPDFQERMQRAAHGGDDVMFRQEARKMAFSVASRAALGAVLTDEDMEKMFPLFEEYSLGTLAINYGLRDGLPGTTYYKSIAASKVLKQMVADRIEAALGGDAVQERDSVIRRLLAHLEEEGLDFSNESDRQVAVTLAKEAVFMMLVGTDNSAYMMLQAMIFLHKHPEWLAAMNEEQARLQEQYGDEMGRQVVSRSAIATAVAEEALRLKPPAKLVFRKAVRDTKLAGIRVPAGTSVMCHIVQASMDTGKSGPDFDPKNWLSEDWTVAHPNTARGNLIWGGGIRRCVGVSLATIELITALCCIGREVKKIDMAPEVADTPFLPFLYPSDMPMRLTPVNEGNWASMNGNGAPVGAQERSASAA